MATVRTAVIEPRTKVFLGMVEVEEDRLDPNIHLVQLGEVDNAPGAYRWAPREDNEYGGRLEPIAPSQRPVAAGGPALEQAYAFDLLLRWSRDRAALPELTLAWLDAVVRSVDFGNYIAAPLVVEYLAERGLKGGA